MFFRSRVTVERASTGNDQETYVEKMCDRGRAQDGLDPDELLFIL